MIRAMQIICTAPNAGSPSQGLCTHGSFQVFHSALPIYDTQSYLNADLRFVELEISRAECVVAKLLQRHPYCGQRPVRRQVLCGKYKVSLIKSLEIHVLSSF